MTAPGPTDTGPVAWARRTFERFVPRGAVLLTVLGLGYFAAGIVRNRVFANTYGAGAELDAYNAAFRIPEIALDVLVSAGLAAPFVPIFTTLRSRDAGAATEFGRTVITAAVVVSAIALAFLFVGAPWLATVVLPKADPATQDLYVQLLRINCFAQVMFAVSICLGEILVADRRFLPYALAPILYTGGIVVGTVLFAGTYGIVATAWGAVAGAAAHLGIRAAGILRTTFRVRPAFAFRTAAFGEFVRLMIPRMISTPIEPLIFTYLTRVASGLAVGSVATLNFALDYQVVPVSLIGVSFSLAVFPTLSQAYAADDRPRFASLVGRNLLVDRGPDDALGGRPLPGRRDPRRGPAGRRRVRPGRRRAHVRGRGRRSPCRCRSTPSPIRCRAGCSRPTTPSARSSPRSPGSASSSWRPRSWSGRSTSSPSRSATPSGWRSRTSCWPSSCRVACAASGGPAGVSAAVAAPPA